MSTSPHDASSVAIARQLASAHPGRMLPCPLCGSVVKSDKLERHLDKAHAAGVSADAVSAIKPLRVRGVDGKMKAPSAILVGVWFAGVLAGTFLGKFKPPLDPVPLVVLSATGLLAVGLLFAAVAGKLPATLELEGETLRVRWMLGLANKRTSLPAALETGVLTRQVGSAINDYDQKTRARQVGTYLRICGSRSITVGAHRAAGANERWAEQGWSKGAARGSADIELERDDLLALEYRLAARGQLQPKPR